MKDELIAKFLTDIEGREPEHIAHIAERMLDQYGEKEWHRGYGKGLYSPKKVKQKALRLIQEWIDPASPGSEANKMLGKVYTDMKERL